MLSHTKNLLIQCLPAILHYLSSILSSGITVTIYTHLGHVVPNLIYLFIYLFVRFIVKMSKIHYISFPHRFLYFFLSSFFPPFLPFLLLSFLFLSFFKCFLTFFLSFFLSPFFVTSVLLIMGRIQSDHKRQLISWLIPILILFKVTGRSYRTLVSLLIFWITLDVN